MNRQLNKGAFFVPLAYIAIIVGLIYLQFSGASIFTENFGNIMLSGTLDIGSDSEDPAVASVSVEYRGLQFNFDEERPLLIETRSNGELRLMISGYQRIEDSLVLYFEEGVEIAFINDRDAEQLVIDSRVPENLGTPESVRIPFLISTGAQASLTENFPGLDISAGGERYILALPPRSYVALETGLLNIPGDSLERSIRYTRRAAGNENIFDLWFQNQLEEIPEALYQAEVDDYIERSYLAWRSNRFDTSSGTWQMRDGSPRFSESILVNVLAEAWSRNEYTRVFNDMRSAADLFPLELSYRSSVFLGNLRTITNEMESVDRQENIRISNMINQANPMVFLKPDLFQYVTDRGSENLLDNLVAFTESLAPTSLTALEALGLSANYYLGVFPDQEVRQILSRFEGVFEELMLPSIARVDEGFFFQTEPGIADSYYTILAGKTLIEMGNRGVGGESGQSGQLISLGRNMILSVLRLSDQLGFLPAQIELTAGAISATLGTSNPEDIYPLLTQNPFYPREISLYEYFGRGAWTYTIMSDYEIDARPGEFLLNFQNTPNRTHFIFFRGMPDIDPLNGMELFGIIWRNAPDFEIYSKGRYYNPDRGTLMIKFFDDESDQDIVVFYE
jgi:hypothetical protein